MAHTPGPWKACEGGAFGIDKEPIPSHVRRIFIDDKRRRVTQFICTSNMLIAEHADNARLIAAAPDLLAALKQAVRDAASATNPSARLPNYEQAVAAIAKAEG